MSKRKLAAPPTTTPPAIYISGVELSLLRGKTGISLEEVAVKTKISMRFLRAIESEDFSQLPGGIYALNYLRQYAEAIGIDPQDLLQRYEHKVNPVSPDDKKPGGRATESRSLLNRLFRVPA